MSSEEKLDKIFHEAFEPDDPVFLDWLNIKNELNNLREMLSNKKMSLYNPTTLEYNHKKITNMSYVELLQTVHEMHEIILDMRRMILT